MSDARGALVLLADLPPAKRPPGDKGRSADRPSAEKARGMGICIPGRPGGRCQAIHNHRLHMKGHRIENAFARLKGWRGIAMRLTPASVTSFPPPSRPQPPPSSACRRESGAWAWEP